MSDISNDISNSALLTGDELIVNGPSYSIKDINGNDYILGKLQERSKWFSPFHETYSLYNNIFIFENAPDTRLIKLGLINSYHNCKKYSIVYLDKL